MPGNGCVILWPNCVHYAAYKVPVKLKSRLERMQEHVYAHYPQILKEYGSNKRQSLCCSDWSVYPLQQKVT